MSNAVQIEALNKRYTRSGPLVIQDFHCHVPYGSICGIIGPNGAGKTTLYSLISGFLRPDSGSINILGQGPFDPWKLRGKMGVLPQDAEIDGRYTCSDFLQYMAVLQGMSSQQAKRATHHALAAVNLLERAQDKVFNLSHGMRRRVATASALLGNPQLVLLDEPMAGLDPIQASSLRDVLLHFRGKGTLMVSSHNLSELERICDWLIIIEKGKLVQQGTVKEIMRGDTHVHWTISPHNIDICGLLSTKLPTHIFSYDAEKRVLRQEAPNHETLDSSAIIIVSILSENNIAVQACHRGMTLESSILEQL